jgi:hypothetical protein
MPSSPIFQIFGGGPLLGAISGAVFVRFQSSAEWPKVTGRIESLIRTRSLTADDHRPNYAALCHSYEVSNNFFSGEWETPSFPKLPR